MQWNLDTMSAEERESFLVAAFKWCATKERLPLPVFLARAQAFPTVSIEIVTVVDSNAGPYVLLEQRPPEDEFFGGKFCSFGATLMMRQPFAQFVDNFPRQEFPENATGIIPNSDKLTFAGVLFAPHSRRQHIVCPVFMNHIKDTWPPLEQGYFKSLGAALEGKLPMVPSHQFGVMPLIKRAYEGAPPGFIEYLGTDE